MDYHKYLPIVADKDVKFLLERETQYKGSWQNAGGRSAWFMIRRKLDRLLNMMERPVLPSDLVEESNRFFSGSVESPTAKFRKFISTLAVAEDIFRKIEENPSGDDATVLAEIRDLRRYLLLVESYMVAKGVVNV